jgi:hypothetical protein
LKHIDGKKAYKINGYGQKQAGIDGEPFTGLGMSVAHRKFAFGDLLIKVNSFFQQNKASFLFCVGKNISKKW